VTAQGKSRPKVRTEGGVPAASRLGFGRDDLSMAAELEEIVVVLPKRRYFLRCGRRPRAAGNGELRRTRGLYPGVAVFGGIMSSKTLQWTAGTRKHRTFAGGLVNGSNRPFAAFQTGRPNGRIARKSGHCPTPCRTGVLAL